MILLIILNIFLTSSEVLAKDSRTIFKFPKSVQIEGIERTIYHYGKTLAEIYLKKESPLEIQFCSLWQVEEVDEKYEFFEEIDRDSSVVRLKLQDMLDLINRCNHHPSTHKISSIKSTTLTPVEDKLVMDFVKTGSQMIFPGTLWCGRGQIANSFNELGVHYREDRCCRGHDFCPVEVNAFTLSNLSPYSKSLCECNKMFYDCLKSIKSKPADQIGRIFFNELDVECINLVPHLTNHNTHVKVLAQSNMKY